ncbi:MAG: hypothetical protein ACRD3O_08945 [Terriglobia bacterium]
MTLAEVEVSLKKLVDNQVVQGEMLGRLERVVAQNTEAIAQNTAAIGHIAQAVASLSDAVAQLNDRTSLMQAGMERLFEHMDRFIRGLEGNGHHRA